MNESKFPESKKIDENSSEYWERLLSDQGMPAEPVPETLVAQSQGVDVVSGINLEDSRQAKRTLSHLCRP